MAVVTIPAISGAPKQTRFITPFYPEAKKVTAAFWAAPKKKQRTIIFADTDEAFYEAFIAHVLAGLDVKAILDQTEAGNHYEHPLIMKAVRAGAVDGKHFLLGTSPDSRAFLHGKVTQNDDTDIMDGSLNWSKSGFEEVNTVSITYGWPEWAASINQAFDETWNFILQHEEKYQTGGSAK